MDSGIEFRGRTIKQISRSQCLNIIGNTGEDCYGTGVQACFNLSKDQVEFFKVQAGHPYNPSQMLLEELNSSFPKTTMMRCCWRA